MRGSWRLNKNCNILSPQLFWLSQPFFPVLLGSSTGGLRAQPLWDMFLNPASSLQLVWSPTASAGCCFLYSIIFQLSLNFLCSELYNSSTSTQSLSINGQRNMQLPPSLEWHVLIIIEQKKNCHTFHRSPSSGVSVCDYTVGF